MGARERRRKRRRLTASAGLSIGAALGSTATADAADFAVSNLNDSGPGSLRQAIGEANAAPGADRVLFQSSLSGQITLSSVLSITDRVEVLGPGPDKLTVNADGKSRVFYIDIPDDGTPEPVTISGLTLTGGKLPEGPFVSGGAIRSKYAHLTVENAVISGNTTGPSGAGGGIAAEDGNVTIRSSTVSGNTADGGPGGGIRVAEDKYATNLTIENSTISGNATVGGGSSSYGGGVGFRTYPGSGSLTVRSSTISGNSASGVNGGGGIFLAGAPTRTISNTIVANNSASTGPDIRAYGAPYPIDASFSLIKDPSTASLVGGPTITGQDPKLGALADNGGPTPTMALLSGSPALDKGSATGTDQRSLTRPFDLKGVSSAPGGNAADIGAYERVLCGKKTVVNQIGTSGKDKLAGTKGADGILGLGGKDKIKGKAGKDCLAGGPGKDTLRGGGGNDKLLGQAGPDILLGGKGKDVLKGGKGKDKQTQ
jgi:Ca2+-binding RTX toxin-like protein